MNHILAQLEQAGKLRHVASFVKEPHYLTIMGSESYGVSTGASDIDVYGFCIPPKQIIFPHLAGYISGFGKPPQGFDQWQEHHIHFNEKEYDFQVYGIVKYFHLCMGGNPNMVDSLFTPDRCILHASKVGRLVRSHRKMFLSKKCYHTFRGYAHEQLKKVKDRVPTGKRKELVDKFSFDVKYAYHLVRLSDECEQILESGDLNLERAREMMKAVRNGEMPLAEIEKWFYAKERHLEDLYHSSTAVPHAPDEQYIKEILLQSLEEFYGSLDRSEIVVDRAQTVVEQIKNLISASGL